MPIYAAASFLGMVIPSILSSYPFFRLYCSWSSPQSLLQYALFSVTGSL
ncbi:TPA: hypothetical protein SMP49_002664 [Proteus mirabilis]|nr:hypothetical protein [Proteus mirabilis]